MGHPARIAKGLSPGLGFSAVISVALCPQPFLRSVLSLSLLASISCGRREGSPEVPSIPQALPSAPNFELPHADPHLQGDLAHLDPATGGWESELAHDHLSERLARMAELLAHSDVLEQRAWVTSDYRGSSLRPNALKTVFQDGALTVKRLSGGTVEPSVVGSKAFAECWLALRSHLAGAPNLRVRFKTVEVQINPDAILTTSHFYAHGGDDTAATLQINATWHCVWTRGDPALLRSIRVEDYEEIIPGREGALHYGDATEAVLGGTTSFGDQLVHGYDYWRERSDRSLVSDLAGNHGLAVGDANGDGLDDLLMTQPGGLPNRLYLHQPDGTAIDGSAEAGIDYLDFSRSALFVDADNDGDQDLLLGLYWGWLVLENVGSGRFTKRAGYPCPGSVYSLAAADYDLDGDLDLFVCGRYAAGTLAEETRVQGIPLPYHDANNGGPSSLWRNDGNLHFHDVTQSAGLDVNNRRFTLAASWEDYDNDGDPDLYVANDFGRNNLYRNEAGQFEDVAAEMGVEDIGAGMSAAWGDANRDGAMDLYVANMFSAAGNRVSRQGKFLPGADDRTLAEYRRHARGNSLFLNPGLSGHDFEDISLAAGVNVGLWAWGSNFVDLNNDGWEDIVVANGFVTTEDTGDL